MEAPSSSTGLSSRTASALSYLGWWVTGLIFWALERRDRLVRFHAIQATIAFGMLALLIGLFGAVALVLLSFAPGAFSMFLWAAFLTWAGSVVLWLAAMWLAARGRALRIPVIAGAADRWAIGRNNKAGGMAPAEPSTP